MTHPMTARFNFGTSLHKPLSLGRVGRILLLCWVWLCAHPFASTYGQIISPPTTLGTGKMERRNYGDRVLLGGKLVIAPGEVVNRVVLIGGELELLGEIRGDLVIVGGKADLKGRIGRSLTVVLGEVSVGENAEVQGEAVLVGGPFLINPNAHLPRVEFMLESGYPARVLHATLGWLRTGPMLGRPYASLEVALLVGLCFFSLYAFLLWMATAPALEMGRLLQTRPMASLLAGMASFVLLGPLCLLLVFSVVAIPAIPLLLCVVAGLTLLGKAALCLRLGGMLWSNGPTTSFQTLTSLATGVLLLSLAHITPVLGLIVWGFTTCWALGVVILWVGASTKSEERPGPSPKDPIPSLGGGVGDVSLAAPSPASSTKAAGFIRRTSASILDWVILACSIPVLGPFVFLLAVAYFVAMWSWKGTTIGGVALRLRVERSTGSPMDFTASFVRSLSSLFSALPLFLGFVWVAWDPRKEAWHDKVAGTRVVLLPVGAPRF